MISFRAFIRSTAALCAVMTAGMCLAEDGVVRMSDRGAKTGNASGDGVVRMGGIQQVGFFKRDSSSCGTPGYPCGEGCMTPQCDPTCCAPSCQTCVPCYGGGCNTCDSCNSGCNNGSCYTPMDCNHCFAGCDASGMPSCWCSDCNCSPCQCHGGRGRGRGGKCRGGYGGCEEVTLFAHSMDSGTGSACRDWWHGQSMSFRNKNARLADRLFGWMIPSGCCGMAGSFGYEEEHFDVSQQIGELVLFPAVRAASAATLIAAPGTSCRHQIKDGTGRVALHPVEILHGALLD